MKRNNILKLSTITLALSLILTGCDSGGGGSDSASSPSPTPPPSLSPILVQLVNSNPTNQENISYQENLISIPNDTQRARRFTGDGSEGEVLFRNKNETEELKIPAEFITIKNQFRSTWLPTIGNLVVPKNERSTDFRTMFTRFLNLHDELKLNAVIFQIRPQLDAFYPSTINPWSEFLNSGVQGENKWTDSNSFDPLKYMIDETHKRGMEYHAWLNPYRVTNFDFSTNTKVKNRYPDTVIAGMSVEDKIAALVEVGILDELNFAVNNPDLVYEYKGRFYLNPAEDEVIEHVVNSIDEIITHYDVDAIQFDDYFYIGESIDEGNFRNEFDFAQSEKTSLADFEQWRRDNVTKLITSVAETITKHNKSNKTAVQFGVSPGGIWCNYNASSCAGGSITSGNQTYQGNTFADTKLWVDKGYLDYLAPQIYWSFELNAAPYGEISYWWNDVINNALGNELIANKKTQLYIGHANYKNLDNAPTDPAWRNPAEIPNQLKYNLTLDAVQGSIFYHYNHIDKNNSKNIDNIIMQSAIEMLKNDHLYTHTLPPAKPWLDFDGSAPETLDAAPQFVVNSLTQSSFNEFTWKDKEDNDTRYYVIYRGTGPVDKICSNPNNIIKKVWKGTQTSFRASFDPAPEVRQSTYLISSVDAAQQESDCNEVKISKSVNQL